MRRIVMLAALLVASSATASAQSPRTVEVRAFLGADMPTGAMRDAMPDAALFGAQAGWRFRRDRRVVGTFGWMPTRTRYEAGDERANVLQVDATLEVPMGSRDAGAWRIEPFVGLGVGARTYLYDAVTLDDDTCAVGVLALGIEWRYGDRALRTELRDNVFCFRVPTPGSNDRHTRNDLAATFGFPFHFW
jgi:hypothetical protein